MTAEGVFAAARQIRPYLPDMLGSGAVGVDDEIGQLLNSGSLDEAVEQQLRELLEERVGTRMFLREVLLDAPHYRPLREQADKKRMKALQPLLGDIDPPPALKYRCPDGNDYDWYQPDIGTPIPLCRTHRCPLVRV